jgi:2'-5' RNA ligase
MAARLAGSAADKQGIMDPLPTLMADHWRPKPGRRPGQPRYHWHMLFHDQPEVRRLAAAAQRKLAGLPGLDLVPEQWLHMTTFAVGYADEVPQASLDVMVVAAGQALAAVAPIPVALGRIVCYPEAVVLAVEPPGALQPVLDAVAAATRAAGCDGRTSTNPWLPHVTVAYSHDAGPAAPIIAALGRRLPRTEITVRSVSLVAQAQVGRSWQWQPVAEVQLGADEVTSGG